MSSSVQPHTSPLVPQIPSSLPYWILYPFRFLPLKERDFIYIYIRPSILNYPKPFFLCSRLDLFYLRLCVLENSGLLFGDVMDAFNKKTKRASVSFGATDDDTKAKLKYQTLLNEYLELQKAYVSSKRKFQAAKQKKQTVLSEVRFLRRKRKYLSETNSSKCGRNRITSEAATENFDQVFVSSSSSKSKEAQGNKPVNEVGEDIRFNKKLKNRIIHDKGVGKRKISWPDQVTLKV